MTALSAPPNGPTATASNPPTDPGLRRRAVVRRTRRLAGRRVAETGQGTQRGTFARLRFSTAPLEPDLETDPRRGTIRQFLVKVGQTISLSAHESATDRLKSVPPNLLGQVSLDDVADF